MRFNLLAATAALVLALPGAVAAQEVDWGSDVNRAWWDGVTGAELRELVTEAEGTWFDEEDCGDVRVSRIEWPDLPGVYVRETNCPLPERPMDERNCGAMLLYVEVAPLNYADWAVENGGWLNLGVIDSEVALYRTELHSFGTTRGHVLATLMLFRAHAIEEKERIRELNGL